MKTTIILALAAVAGATYAQDERATVVKTETWTVKGKQYTVRHAAVAKPISGKNTVQIVHDGKRVVTLFSVDRGKAWTPHHIVDARSEVDAKKIIEKLGLAVPDALKPEIEEDEATQPVTGG